MRQKSKFHQLLTNRYILYSLILGAFFGLIYLSTSSVFALGQGNLAGYWKLDETTAGSTAVDSSGNGNNLTAVNSPQPSTLVPANISYPDTRSLSFSGSNTLEEANPSGVNYGTSPRSISMWIYPTVIPSSSEVPAAYGVCAYGGNGNNLGKEFGVYIDSSMDLHYWGCGSSYDFNTNHTVPINQWTNVVVTYNGSIVTVYINGISVAFQARVLVAQGGSSTPYMEIGSASLMDAGPDYYTGNVDDVKVYTRALSPTEVSEIASTGNTSATWTGGSSSNWQNAANWNINAVPDAYTNITIGNGTYQPVLASATGLAGLTIDSGSSLNLNGNNLTMNDLGSFTNNGTLILEGSESLVGFNNNISNGTVEYDGSGSYSSLDLGSMYYNLNFDGSGSWTLNNPLTVYSNLNIISGTLSSAGNNISVAGSWSNNGTFNANNDLVSLNGNNQSIAGNTIFYNLSKATSNGGVLTFQAGTTQTITNNLSLAGTTGNLLALESSSSGVQWSLDPTGSFSLDYLSVTDGNNLNTTLLNPSNSLDGGDNLNWFLPYKPADLGPSSYVNNSYTNNSSPALSFTLSNSDTHSNVRYELEVASNSNFNSPLINYISALMPQGNYSFTIGQQLNGGNYLIGATGQFLADGSYYWQVQTIDSGGNSSGYIAANNGAIAFSIDTVPPTVPGQPITLSPTTSLTPAWTWSASLDSISGLASPPYVIEWSNSPTFLSGVYSTTSNTNSLVLPVYLTPGTWYVRVKAVDVAGNSSAYSLVGSVNIITSTSKTASDNDADQTSRESTVNEVSTITNIKPKALSANSKFKNNIILLNNYVQYTSGSGKEENLSPNQVVYFKVDKQTHSITVDKVGGDYVTLTLRSNPRVVNMQIGDTDEYDVTGSGKPDIKITLLGIYGGIARLSFAQVGLPIVNVSLSHASQQTPGYIWLVVLLVGIAIGMWIMWRWNLYKNNS